MKHRGRRRKPYVEIIPHRPGFRYDRATDLYLPVDSSGAIIPRMKLSAAQREAIGEELFGLKLESENPADPELGAKIAEFLLKPRVGLLPKFEAIAQARDYCAILLENGYYDYQWWVDRLNWELRCILGWCCQRLARDLLSDHSISEAERNQGFLFLGSFSDEQWDALMRAIGAPLAPDG